VVIFFHPLMDFTVKVSGGNDVGIQGGLPKVDSTRTSKDILSLAYKTLKDEYPKKDAINIWVYNMNKMGAYTFSSGKPGLKSVENVDFTVYNRYTGNKIQIDRKAITHEKTKNVVWQLHMGQWWGQIGKLFTFITGIIATSLSITGFLIWWGRRSKKRKKAYK